MSRRVLVIRLGALGDFVLSFPAFAAIRAHEATAEIILLTTAPFAALARRAPWFDRVEIDRRPGAWNLPGLLGLTRRLRGFAMVYDLQTSRRSSQYRRLAGGADWSGIAPGSSHPHANPARDGMHTTERQHEQLVMAGVRSFPRPDLAWLTGAERQSHIPPPFALLVPGASPHRPAKRWPVERYAELARTLRDDGITPVVIGTAVERPLAAAIPDAIDLCGRTSLFELAALAARASVSVGNDTGPMHLAAAVGCPSVVLFSADSDPALTAARHPDGAWPTVLREDDLAHLPAARVAQAALAAIRHASACQPPCSTRGCGDHGASP